MPRTPDEFPGVSLDEGICLYDQYGDMPDCYGGIVYSDGYFYAKDSYGTFNLRGGESAGYVIHGYRHIHNGSDEIDGDKLNVNFTPTNYTPDTTPPEVDSTQELTAHLSGIDGYLNNLGNEKLNIDNHKTLRHLIHFIDEGPGDGFTSGATKQILPVGSAFPTQILWKDFSGNIIVEKNITRNDNQTPSIIEWKIYDIDGVTVLATVTDTISYSGVFEISRSRSII